MRLTAARGAGKATLVFACLIFFLCPLVSSTAVPRPAELPPHVPGEVLIKFRRGAGLSAQAQASALVEGERVKRIRGGVERWKLGAGISTEEAIRLLSGDPDVEYVEPNYIVSIAIAPDDPDYPLLWGLHNTGQTDGSVGADIDAEQAWDVTRGSRSVLVGVTDTGVDYTHPDLAANIWTNPGEVPDNGLDDDHNGYIDDVHGWDFVNDDNDPFDDNGHGTHCAGTIGAVGDNGEGIAGVNWQVSIVPLKVLGGGGSGSTAGTAEATQYAAMMGLDVTNNSYGGGPASQPMLEAIQAANTAGVLFVAAAGNSRSNNDVFPAYPASYDVPNVVAVAATDHNDELASFSSFGREKVHLGAPGVAVLSTTPGNTYSTFSGTSMASPHVVGVAALVRAINPDMPVDALKRALLDGAEPNASLDEITVTGGRLNAASSVEHDTASPDPIEDLAVTGMTSTTAFLTWTASGDDHDAGSAASYDLRYATHPLDESNFFAAPRVRATPRPQPAGSIETLEVKGLASSTLYHFALRPVDDKGNVPSISNVVTGTTLPAPTFSSHPGSFSGALFTGETATRTLTLANVGVGTLDWLVPAPSVSGPAGASLPQWLSASPVQGRLHAGQQQDVVLTLDAAGLPGGTYQSSIVVVTNDPLNPSVEHPVTLQVTSAAAMTVSPPSWDFGSVFLGFGSNLVLTITNTGVADLTANLRPGDPGVTLSTSSLLLRPGESAQVGVNFTAHSPGPFASQVAIDTNNPGAPTVEVPLSALVVPAPGIAVAPLSYTENLLNGSSVTRNLRVTNTGGSDLVVHLTTDDSAGQQGHLPVLVNGGFEHGNFGGGWTATSNGLVGLLPWGIASAKGDHFRASTPSEGRFYALNGFEGEAGLVYDLYRELDLPPGTKAVLKFDDRIQYDSLGAPSALPRVYEATLEDMEGRRLATIVREEIVLNGRSFTDTGWRQRSISLTPFAGRRIRLHLHESIPESFTGPASIEFDAFRILGSTILDGWLEVTPNEARILPSQSQDFTVTFAPKQSPTAMYTGSIRLSTNIPDAPMVRVPAILSVTGAPDIAVSGSPVTLESSRAYFFEGDMTSHELSLPAPPVGSGTVRLIAEGDFGQPFEKAIVTAEGLVLGSVGASGGDCMIAAEGSFLIPAWDFQPLAADGVLNIEVQNLLRVGVGCSENRHTVQLTYAGLVERLDFGPVFVGAHRDLEVLVHNLGSEVLQVTSIASANSDFTPSLGSLELDPNQSALLAVRFTPASVTPYASTLTIQSNDLDMPALSIPMSGSGIEPPVAMVSPESLSVLQTGGQEIRPLTIHNAGGNPLDFSVGVREKAPVIESLGLSPGQLSTGPAGDFEPLTASPAPLTCVVEDHAAGALYAQAKEDTSFYRYRAGDDFWESLSPAPRLSGGNGGAALLNGKIYTTYIGNVSALGVYDIGTDKWTTMPHPLRVRTANIASDGVRYLYLVAGFSLLRVDPATSAVTTLPPPPFAFEPWGGIRHLDGRLYGHQGRGSTRFASFDIATGRWVELSRIPGPAALGAALDPFARVYYATGPYRGNNLYRYSIDLDEWSVLPIPFFSIWYGGMGVLPHPSSGLYFAQGESGTGFARLVSEAFLQVSPESGTVPPFESIVLDAIFDATGRSGLHAADILVSSNDPVNRLITIPATMTVGGVPDLRVSGAPVTVESTVHFSLGGERTELSLPVHVPHSGDAVFRLSASGSFGSGGKTATATSEGSLQVTVGDAGAGCLDAHRDLTVSEATLAALAADGVVNVSVQNTFFVEPICAVNKHHVSLTYSAPSDHLDCGRIFVGRERTAQIVVANAGTGVLHFGSIEASPPFTAAVPSTVLAPGASQPVTVTFRPPSDGAFSGTLTIGTDDPDTPLVSVPLSGVGLEAPRAGISPQSMALTLARGESETLPLTISNSGGNALDYSIHLRENGPQGEPVFERLRSSPDELAFVVEDSVAGLLYAQSAQGSRAFYRYRASHDVWERLADAPIGPLRGGATLLGGRIITSYAGNNRMGVYDIATNTWTTAFGLATGTANIVSDGSRYLYLLFGSQFRRLDTFAGFTADLASPPFPLDRGGIRYLDGVIYAHRAGLSRQFASYDVATNLWTILPLLPSSALSGAAIDSHQRQYFTHGMTNSGPTLYRFSIDSGTWSVLPIPVFPRVGNGGLAILSSPDPGLYFVQGDAGTLLGRFVSGLDLIRFSPGSGSVAPSASSVVDVLIEGASREGLYEAELQISTNDDTLPDVTVPVSLTIIELPKMVITGEQVIVSSSREYKTFRAWTSHLLPVPGLPGGNGAVEILAVGEYGGSSQSVMVSAEGSFLGGAGGNGLMCGQAPGVFPIAGDALASLLADGFLSLVAQNSAGVGVQCSTNMHTLRLTYPGRSDRLDFAPSIIGSTRTLNLVVSNAGHRRLHLTSIGSTRPEFIPSTTSLDIDPRGSSTLSVSFTPGMAGAHEGVLTLVTNDPRSPEVSIPLSGAGIAPPEVAAAPAVLSSTLFFGEQETKVVTLTNSGAGPLHFALNLSSSNRLPFVTVAPASGVVPPAGSASINVHFDGRSALGDYSAEISISSDDPMRPMVTVNASLQVLGAPVILPATDEAVPQPLTAIHFGPTAPGGVRRKTALVQNVGNGVLIADVSSDSPLFTVTPASLTIQPGQAERIEVAFAPVAEGPFAATLTFSSNDRANPSILLPMTGTGERPPVIGVEPAALDATLRAPAEETQSLRIRNTGVTPLSFSITVPPPELVTLSPASGTIPGGGEVDIDVTFHSDLVPPGPSATALLIASNDPMNPLVTVPVSMYVLWRPAISVQGPPITIRGIRSFTTAGAQTTHRLSLSPAPAGGADLVVTAEGSFGETGRTASASTGLGHGLTVGGTGGGCVTATGLLSLPPGDLLRYVIGGAMTVRVQNTPQVDASCPVNRHTVSLTYTPIVQSLDFEPTFLGTSVVRNLFIVNSGTDLLTISSIGADTPEFEASPAAFTLPPAASQVVAVRFTPAAEGDVFGSLEIESDAENAPSTVLTLTGAGIPAPVAALSQGLFTVALPPGGSGTRSIRITNTGGSDLLWSAGAPGAAGPDPLPPWITATPSQGAVQPGSFADVVLALDAAGLADGDHAQVVSFFSNDPARPRLDASILLHVGEVMVESVTMKPPTLRLSSKEGLVEAIVTLPAAYDPSHVIVSSVRMNGDLAPVSGEVSSGDEAGDLPRLILRFDRAAFEAILTEGVVVPLTITGEVRDQTWFRGETVIRVVRQR